MKRTATEKGLDIALAVCGVFFFAMGMSDLGKDLFGVLLGLSAALPLLSVYLWRKLREHKGKSVKIRPGTLVLFCIGLFFLMMGVSSFASNRNAVVLGLSVGVPVCAIYLWLRIRELRELDAESAEQARASVRPAPEPPLTICPHCSAPSKDAVCPYCGMSKKP